MGLRKHSFYSLTFKYSLTTELWHCEPSIIEHGCGTVGSVFQVRYLVGRVLDVITPAIVICPFFRDTHESNCPSWPDIVHSPAVILSPQQYENLNWNLQGGVH